MIVSEVNGSKVKKGNGFPKLMIAGNTIVLFLTEDIGTLLQGDESEFIGNFYTSWNMEGFENFEGSITLSNDKG